MIGSPTKNNAYCGMDDHCYGLAEERRILGNQENLKGQRAGLVGEGKTRSISVHTR